MFIQESLRLYGPGVTTAREVLAEMKLGEHVLPKGIKMWLYLPAILQRDTDNWGPDAREFKLERLVGGVSAAWLTLVTLDSSISFRSFTAIIADSNVSKFPTILFFESKPK
ncbi:hypothetical protein JHK87_052198 [Glycine soja]|nr:hypothetical protein JHK87_052198 [Glycine soja]